MTEKLLDFCPVCGEENKCFSGIDSHGIFLNCKSKEPEAVWEGSFIIFGKTLRCYVLDNGQRIINAEDLEDFFMNGGVNSDAGDMQKFAQWQKGAPQQDKGDK